MEQEIVIHGGGYVGLIGGVHMALVGVNVTFYDPDQTVVDAINAGKPKANEYLGYINEDVKTLVNNGKIKATTDYDSIKDKPVHFLAVPTEKGDSPCMDIVKKCIENLHESVPYKGLIIIESTLQPGTIDSLDLPRVQRNDIYLAVCPRLDWFADSTKNVTNLPRIVGGVTPESTYEAIQILSKICQDIHPTNYRVAEFAKAGQNHLYFVQIMAAHEMARVFQGNTDMNEALRLIGVHWRLPELYLGTGVSGRCIQMGTQYIRDAAQTAISGRWLGLAEEALHVNERWRQTVGDRLTRELKIQGDKILILGIAYRPNFSDFGYSSGLSIAKYLEEFSWDVSIHDPIVNIDLLQKSTKIPFRALNSTFDAILLGTAHDAYLQLPETIGLWRKGQFVLDATGAWEMYRKLFDAWGVKYIRVGEQNWMEK